MLGSCKISLTKVHTLKNSILIMGQNMIVQSTVTILIQITTFVIKRRKNNLKACIINAPRVVTGEKNSPTVAHACRKRRLKWVLGA
jgi:hypothetical protein